MIFNIKYTKKKPWVKRLFSSNFENNGFKNLKF